MAVFVRRRDQAVDVRGQAVERVCSKPDSANKQREQQQKQRRETGNAHDDSPGRKFSESKNAKHDEG
jgi:hypothetical protein